MRIINTKTNKISNPLGFQLDSVVLSYQVVDSISTAQTSARIEVSKDFNFDVLVFDSGWDKTISPIGYKLNIELEPRTRYYWRVTVIGNSGESGISDIAWFETAKMNEAWNAKWISTDIQTEAPLFSKTVTLANHKVKSVRAYISGLGLYELYINDQKVGNEYLAPGCNAYDQWIQYQTYDIEQFRLGENKISVLLGNGWYKGRFGFNDGGKINHYGDTFQLIAEIVITYDNGEQETICTDESWQVADSHITHNSIYDGEMYDETHPSDLKQAIYLAPDLTSKLAARRSLPIVIHQRIKPTAILDCADGSKILDFGQNLVGWVEFRADIAAGATIHLKYAEIMQNDDIYVDNLRTAKAEFTYISSGKPSLVQPHFTFYGFRFVKVTGITQTSELNDFVACFIYSDIEQQSTLTTKNKLVNQLVNNVIRSQKDNFVDLPTDCPQRDERMGWTGDIQVFSSAACMNMDVYAFLSKYLYDLAIEQEKMKGAVPFVVPMFDVLEGGSSAWGDAATIIPWTMWLHYGDDSVLRQQFHSMKAWVDYIEQQTHSQSSTPYLWNCGFHFGDWLAMDNEPHIKSFKGKTEDQYIASIYYYYSSLLVSKTALVLGLDSQANHYTQLANNVLNEIRNEYLTANGKLALDTQTAYILAIMFDIYTEDNMPRAAKDFEAKLAKDQYKIKTGFVGTPYFCKALTKVGLNDLAYKIFLNTEKPSWLYSVTQGATTIWERWDSVNDGVINPDSSMNSLNHYALGSVIDWLYKEVCGLNPVEEQPGFKKASIKPVPNYRLGYAALESQTIAGLYKVSWTVTDEGKIDLSIAIPFNCSANVYLPDCPELSSVDYTGCIEKAQRDGSFLNVFINAGEYTFNYQPTKEYISRYNIDMPIRELLNNSSSKIVMEKYIPDILSLPFLPMLENESLKAISTKPFYKYRDDVIDEINRELSTVIVS